METGGKPRVTAGHTTGRYRSMTDIIGAIYLNSAHRDCLDSIIVELESSTKPIAHHSADHLTDKPSWYSGIKPSRDGGVHLATTLTSNSNGTGK